MRILLSNHHCYNFGGTENYTVDLARYFYSQGHQVAIYLYTKQDKMPSYEFFKSKYPSISWYISQLPPNNFDLILLNHNTTLNVLKNYKGYKICTTHGLHGLEKLVGGANFYVCISQELFDQYPEIQNKTIIRTGFFLNEIEQFEYKKVLDRPTAILLDYTPSPEGKNHFMSICKKLGVWSEVFSSKNLTPLGMKTIYKNYDIICATGRTALEATLSGKRTIIYSHFGCDGILIPELDKTNLSGRFYKDLSKFEKSLQEVLELPFEKFRSIQEMIRTQRNIKVVAQEYLKLFEDRRG